MLEMREIIESGQRSRDRRTTRFCRRLLGVWPALWMFVMFEGMEPTNNHAQRVLRRAVLWRRRAFGCASANGYRFVERILTVVQSLRLQKRSVFDYLAAVIDVYHSGHNAPPLATEG